MAALGIVILAGWSLFAFAGAYRWTTLPLLVGVVALTAAERPAIIRRPNRTVDLALLLCLCTTAAQLVPLRAPTRLALSPSAGMVDQTLRLGEASDPTGVPPRPLSIDPEGTAWGFVDGLCVVLLFWCARSRFGRHGVRTVARGVAWLGLVLSAVAILQHATAPGLIYWYWHPANASVRPFGPFVNRNHIATWLIMAIPLAIGYLMARVRARGHTARDSIELASTVDAMQIWIGASTLIMMAALIVSLSRSGITGLAVALAAFVWLAASRLGHARVKWLLLGLLALVAAALTYVNTAALANRLGEAWSGGLGERSSLWTDTWSMIVAFWPTGLGIGAYERGMLVYQQSTRLFHFTHADNEYLQIAAEGGILVGAPIAIAVLATIARAITLLRQDRSAIYWIRVGATCGLIAVAVQSVWENGLRLPANAVLFAVLAALAVHQHQHAASSTLPSGHPARDI